MAGKKRDKVKSDDIVGFKYFKILADMLETLHGAACARDRARNRILHMDQYIALLLMYMFNPICSSLRAMQEASDFNRDFLDRLWPTTAAGLSGDSTAELGSCKHCS